MIKISDLKVKYGNDTVLDIKDEIVINKGDKIGLVGSNGAGKSTLIGSIIGYVNYTGNIKTGLKYDEIAVHLQQNGYNEYVSVKMIIETIINQKISENKRVQELINFFNFGHCLNKRFKNLSGGEKQKLTIILIIMQDAELTIYDEVTSGLDFESRKSLMDKLNEVYEASDKTLILVSHYYEELENLADKILLLDKGKVICFGKKADLFKKYCGESVIVVQKNDESEKVLKEFKKVIAPSDKIAVTYNSNDEKEKIINKLLKEKIGFSVKYDDIEIITLNAKDAYYKENK